MPSSPKSEAGLTAPVLSQRDRVLESLSRRFRAPLLRFFEKRIGKHSETEDLAQEVFMRLASSERIDAVEHMEAYLFKTASNLLRDRQRRLTVRAFDAHEPYEDDVHGLSADAHTPERAFANAEAIQQLVTALQELSEKTRNVWILYHIDDLPHATIASRLGMAVSTIEKHLHRANLHLLQRIDRPLW